MVYPATLMIDTAAFSETFIHTCQTTLHHITEDGNLTFLALKKKQLLHLSYSFIHPYVTG